MLVTLLLSVVWATFTISLSEQQRLTFNHRAHIIKCMLPGLQPDGILFLDTHIRLSEMERIEDRQQRAVFRRFSRRATKADWMLLFDFIYGSHGSEDMFGRLMDYLNLDHVKPALWEWLEDKNLTWSQVQMTMEWIRLSSKYLKMVTERFLMAISGDPLAFMSILCDDESDEYEPIISSLLLRIQPLLAVSLDHLIILRQILRHPRAVITPNQAQVDLIFSSDYIHDLLFSFELPFHVANRLFFWAIGNFEPRLYEFLGKLLSQIIPAASDLRISNEGPTALMAYLLRRKEVKTLAEVVVIFDDLVEKHVISDACLEPLMHHPYWEDIQVWADSREHLPEEYVIKYFAYPMACQPKTLQALHSVIDNATELENLFWHQVIALPNADIARVLRAWLHVEPSPIGKSFRKALGSKYFVILERIFHREETLKDRLYLHPELERLSLSHVVKLLDSTPAAQLCQVVERNPLCYERLCEVLQKRKGEVSMIPIIHICMQDENHRDYWKSEAIVILRQSTPQIFTDPILPGHLVKILQAPSEEPFLNNSAHTILAICSYPYAGGLVMQLFSLLKESLRFACWLEMEKRGSRPEYLAQIAPLVLKEKDFNAGAFLKAVCRIRSQVRDWHFEGMEGRVKEMALQLGDKDLIASLVEHGVLSGDDPDLLGIESLSL